MAATAAKPKGNVLTRKAGPLPVWVWAAAGLALVWFVFFRGSSAPAQATQAGPAATQGIAGSLGSGSGGGASPPSGPDASLLSQLAAAGATGAGGGEGVTAGEAGGTGGTSTQAAADAGAPPSSIQQTGPASENPSLDPTSIGPENPAASGTPETTATGTSIGAENPSAAGAPEAPIVQPYIAGQIVQAGAAAAA